MYVDELVELINGWKDSKGNTYAVITKTIEDKMTKIRMSKSAKQMLKLMSKFTGITKARLISEMKTVNPTNKIFNIRTVHNAMKNMKKKE